MKIDLHLHSKHSKRPTHWVLQKIGCPESFSEPQRLAATVTQRGMDAMTLTDHNTINGCLELMEAGHPVFISEEVTSYFPEDGCKTHVLVYDIDEAIHAEIQKVRKNVYDLVAFLRGNDILHAVAHPLIAINNRLELHHFERMLLLFQNIELNGAADPGMNRVLRATVEALTPEVMAELAERHHLEPSHPRPWRKGLIAGSDDHSLLNVARTHTEVEGVSDIQAFLEGVRRGESLPRYGGSGPRMLGHNLYAIAYQFYRHRFGLGRYAANSVLIRFLDRLCRPGSRDTVGVIKHLMELWGQRKSRRSAPSRADLGHVLWREAESLILSDPQLRSVYKGGRGADPEETKEDRWFDFVDQASSRILNHCGQKMLGRLSGGGRFLNFFDSLGAAASWLAVMAPYFVAYACHGRDRALCRQVEAGFAPEARSYRAPAGEIRVAHFTDTFYEVNGVARTLRQQAELAARAGKDLTIITSAPHQPAQSGRVRNFTPVDVHDLPEYQEVKLVLPPFLSMLDHVFAGQYTHLHSATPGPVGLAALAIARILKLPICATYHTAFPQYAAYLTGDANIEEAMWRYVVWYYDQMHSVYVPSQDTADELAARGIAPEKLRLYPRGVDIDRFHPRHKNGFFAKYYNLNGSLKVLYVGRVSREKNLPLLAGAFRELSAGRPGVELVVVGEGPYLDEMKAELADYPATFTGYLHGGNLAEAYASSDLFVFPSTTDTFGNVILEAQASGLPVIVTDAGGPRENLLPGQTGLVVPGGDGPALYQAMAQLCDDGLRRKQMAKSARAYMEERSFEKAFLKHWGMYTREGALPPAGPDLEGLARMAGGLGGLGERAL